VLVPTAQLLNYSTTQLFNYLTTQLFNYLTSPSFLPWTMDYGLWTINYEL